MFKVIATLTLAMSLLYGSQDAPTDSRQKLSEPHLISEVDPIAPVGEEFTSGTCTLKVLVGADGKVVQVRVVHSINAKVDNAVKDAVEDYLFKPGEVDGRPSPMWMTLDVRVNMPFHPRKGLLRR